MSKKVVVDFNHPVPWILINPEPSFYEGKSGFVVDPDLSAVNKYPPHCWHLVDGKIQIGEERSVNSIHSQVVYPPLPPTLPALEVPKQPEPQIIERTIHTKEYVHVEPQMVWADYVAPLVVSAATTVVIEFISHLIRN